MKKNQAILDILNRWPSRRAMAADVGKDIIVIHRWFQRESIPPEYDATLIDAAAQRGIDLGERELMDARSGHSEQSGHTMADIQVGGQK